VSNTLRDQEKGGLLGHWWPLQRLFQENVGSKLLKLKMTQDGKGMEGNVTRHPFQVRPPPASWLLKVHPGPLPILVFSISLLLSFYTLCLQWNVPTPFSICLGPTFLQEKSSNKLKCTEIKNVQTPKDLWRVVEDWDVTGGWGRNFCRLMEVKLQKPRGRGIGQSRHIQHRPSQTLKRKSRATIHKLWACDPYSKFFFVLGPSCDS
jgi:hypothetical protein